MLSSRNGFHSPWQTSFLVFFAQNFAIFLPKWPKSSVFCLFLQYRASNVNNFHSGAHSWYHHLEMSFIHPGKIHFWQKKWPKFRHFGPKWPKSSVFRLFLQNRASDVHNFHSCAHSWCCHLEMGFIHPGKLHFWSFLPKNCPNSTIFGPKLPKSSVFLPSCSIPCLRSSSFSLRYSFFMLSFRNVFHSPCKNSFLPQNCQKFSHFLQTSWTSPLLAYFYVSCQ